MSYYFSLKPRLQVFYLFCLLHLSFKIKENPTCKEFKVDLYQLFNSQPSCVELIIFLNLLELLLNSVKFHFQLSDFLSVEDQYFRSIKYLLQETLLIQIFALLVSSIVHNFISQQQQKQPLQTRTQKAIQLIHLELSVISLIHSSSMTPIISYKVLLYHHQ